MAAQLGEPSTEVVVPQMPLSAVLRRRVLGRAEGNQHLVVAVDLVVVVVGEAVTVAGEMEPGDPRHRFRCQQMAAKGLLYARPGSPTVR